MPKKIGKLVAATKIDTARGIAIAGAGNWALQVICAGILIAVHVASLVMDAGSQR